MSDENEIPQISNGVNKFFQSKSFKILLIVIGALILILSGFKAGEFVGFRKARFSYRWAENYNRNFAGPRGGFMHQSFGKEYVDAHGTVGQIIKIDGNTLVIKGQNDVEKTILISDKTVINRLRDNIKVADLKVDDLVVVIGSPDDSGQIEAKLIRIMPPPRR